MPELPEVEVVKRSLSLNIRNLIIKKVKVNDSKLRYRVKKKDLNILIGKKILRIHRRSKFLVFYLEKDIFLLIHLGMTGKFFYVNKKNKKMKTSFYYETEKSNKKHNHIIFYLSGHQKLIYNDVRKFGFVKTYNKKKFLNNIHFKSLGPEPLKNDFNYKYFVNFIDGRKRNIKSLLMDQKFVSGLGNIYVNEILFLSKIKPSRQVKNLKTFEITNIIKNTKKILKNAITLGGSSIKDFSSGNGKKGSFQQKFNVYGKKGDKCSNADCNNILSKISIGNRASFYCSSCQK
tara:strand:- start:1414 stop:2280 length:867 start_codon:yes stop_codon:yes gene_type:complete